MHAGLAEHGYTRRPVRVGAWTGPWVSSEAERHLTLKETGPRIGPDEWQRLGEAAADPAASR